MPAFEDVVDRNSGNVRKVLQGGVYLGKYGVAADITTLTAVDGITLPEDYESVGWISEDGLSFSTETEVADVRPWGSGHFIRRDVTSTDRTVSFSALETNRLVTELVSGLDLSTTEMSVEGEVVLTHPDRQPTTYWRMLTLGVDGEGDGRFYLAKFYPRAVLSERGEESWSDGDDALMYEVTMTALIDDVVGTACREFLFGPGALAAAAEMGWTVAVA